MHLHIIWNTILSKEREDFFMLLIECNNIKKYFGDKLILDFEHLEVHSEDRIGVVGINGAGKTTLLNILSSRLEPDEGQVKLYGRVAYISQLEPAERQNISSEMASRFGVGTVWNEHMSGGEKTRFKLAAALDDNSSVILADEPTSNVDMEGIELMAEKFMEYNGALMVISHDRNFLDKICNEILEIEDGKIKLYNGNYSAYRDQKIHERERAQLEYEEYVKEKKRLEGVIEGLKRNVKSMRKTPKRMGNSEARLHKMGPQKSQAALERAVKNVEKRIQHLEVKEKPKEQPEIKLDIQEGDRLHSKIIIEGKNITKVFGEKIIFKEASFSIYNNSKVALIGPNGCGKTTLIKMIMDNDASIRIAKGAKIGYFSQEMDILNKNLSIIENVMESSIYPESFARLLLARLLFRGDEVYKKVHVLSGGEQVKVSFAKMLLQDINLLILDEPTNYMDINSLEVMEESLREYNGTLLFVSHDRRFVDALADHIMTIEDMKIRMFSGNYAEYLEKRKKSGNETKEDIEKQVLLLRNRLSEVIGRLSMPSKNDDVEALNKEYFKIMDELRELDNILKSF